MPSDFIDETFSKNLGFTDSCTGQKWMNRPREAGDKDDANQQQTTTSRSNYFGCR